MGRLQSDAPTRLSVNLSSAHLSAHSGRRSRTRARAIELLQQQAIPPTGEDPVDRTSAAQHRSPIERSTTERQHGTEPAQSGCRSRPRRETIDRTASGQHRTAYVRSPGTSAHAA